MIDQNHKPLAFNVSTPGTAAVSGAPSPNLHSASAADGPVSLAEVGSQSPRTTALVASVVPPNGPGTALRRLSDSSQSGVPTRKQITGSIEHWIRRVQNGDPSAASGMTLLANDCKLLDVHVQLAQSDEEAKDLIASCSQLRVNGYGDSMSVLLPAAGLGDAILQLEYSRLVMEDLIYRNQTASTTISESEAVVNMRKFLRVQASNGIVEAHAMLARLYLDSAYQQLDIVRGAAHYDTARQVLSEMELWENYSVRRPSLRSGEKFQADLLVREFTTSKANVSPN